MSTSPSWFDQEKFSRLVKKVGPKPASGPAAPAKVAPASPPPRPPEKDTRRLLRAQESTAQPKAAPTPFPPIPRPVTSRLPAVSENFPAKTEFQALPPEPLVQENESLPPLSLPLPAPDSPAASAPLRRTSPLPNLKPIFEYDKPAPRPPAPAPPAPELEPELLQELDEEEEPFVPESKPSVPETKPVDLQPEFPALNQSSEDLAAAWAKVSSLNQELSTAIGERDAARKETALLQSQLTEMDDTATERDDLTAQLAELSRVEQERNDARNESSLLRQQLHEAEKNAESGPASGSPELTRALEERDGARRDYATLREQFETMKLEQVRLRAEPAKKDPVLQQELESLRTQLAAREEEINALKQVPAPGASSADIESLKRESSALQAQVNQAREEASIAQRGLALSQKALQETRDALREASEGSSQFKNKLQSLKAEIGTLEQQNMMLQAQNDQLSREFSAAKAKLATRS